MPLPHALCAILRAAKANDAESVTITPNLPKPDIAGLPDDIIDQISTVAPQGKRSDVDWATIRYLVRAWWGDDQIAGVFQHYPIWHRRANTAMKNRR
ncbi:MAG: hypothetical protein R2867_42160 [Caldilineaceae bacterium]